MAHRSLRHSASADGEARPATDSPAFSESGGGFASVGAFNLLCPVRKLHGEWRVTMAPRERGADHASARVKAHLSGCASQWDLDVTLSRPRACRETT